MKRKPFSPRVPLRWFIILLLATRGAPAMAQTRSDHAARTISFADRIAYQYAIEEVYWRHRVWPKENPGAKPPLDAVLSRQQVENKVEKYLGDSQRPITPAQLQVEMNRMARYTRHPDTLREIFAALGNDPFVIAECLVRSMLVERLAADSAARNERNLNSTRTPANTQFNRYVLPQVIGTTCTDDAWVPITTANAPSARQQHTTVWTGSEMIVWGGFDGSAANTGARYNPTTDSWSATTVSGAPAGRFGHTTVWTGSEMIVWGGDAPGPANSGGRYNPTSDTWTQTTAANAPGGREDHTAVWTGSEMIVWGGNNGSSGLNTGGRYNPTSNTWIPTSTTGAPSARYFHTAVWSGHQMIIWGGEDISCCTAGGGRYDPSTDMWTPTTLNNEPQSRFGHTAVWTGSEMIIWGVVGSTGGRYDPVADTWTATSITNAPSPRYLHTAIWKDNEMIVWGGDDTNGYSNTGGRYAPITDSWVATGTAGVPIARASHTAIWTGDQMIIWGGRNGSNLLNSGASYCAYLRPPFPTQAVSQKTHGAAGVFDVGLPLSGTPGIECRIGGATNDYTVAVTFAGNVTVNGSPQAAVTQGIGTIGSGGIPNGGVVVVSGNTVTIPLTNVGNVQTINITLYEVNGGGGNLVIPMSVLAGDVNGNGIVNAADVSLTKSRIGQTIDATNFRSDVNAGGSINGADVSIIKANLGSGLP